jgi:hypothetical protein
VGGAAAAACNDLRTVAVGERGGPPLVAAAVVVIDVGRLVEAAAAGFVLAAARVGDVVTGSRASEFSRSSSDGSASFIFLLYMTHITTAHTTHHNR